MTQDEYLDATVQTWLGLPTGASVPTLPTDLARRLLRIEEYERTHRDQWGCWEYGFCESHREGRLWEPDVDTWSAEQRRRLAASTALEPLWPEGRNFAICMTHDVDLISESSTPAQVVRSVRTSLGSPRGNALVTLVRPPVRVARAARRGIGLTPTLRALERSVDVERELGIPASYLFTVFPGQGASRYDCTYSPSDRCRFRGRTTRVADVLVELAHEGFDVGLHGSYPSALEEGRLARERAALEQATGLDIRTTRQHFIHWDARRTPRLQQAAGLTVDSSLGFNRNLGFRAGTSLPFRHFDVERDEQLDVLQVPLVVHDGPLFRSDGLELDAELAREAVRGLLDRVAAVGGVATVLFHPDNLMRREFADLHRWTIEYGLERGAWFASLRTLERWWREREARLRAA